MVAFTVRPAVLADAPAIAAIYAHHVQEGSASFDTSPRSVMETEAKIDACLTKGWPFLAAQQAGHVVGYAYATQFRDRPAYASSCENSIYIDPGHQRRGVGKALLAALLAQAEAAGFRQMIAVIGGGEAASVALHAKLGFDHAGTMRSVGRKFGRWLDTVYMQIALGVGDGAPPLKEPQ